MLVKFEQNRMVHTARNFQLLDKKTNKQTKTKNKNNKKQKQKTKTKQKKKTRVLIIIFDKELTPFWKTFL